MENQYYKIEITKKNDTWYALLYNVEQPKECCEMAKPIKKVEASNYSEMLYKIADEGLLDFLNKN